MCFSPFPSRISERENRMIICSAIPISPKRRVLLNFDLDVLGWTVFRLQPWTVSECVCVCATERERDVCILPGDIAHPKD